MNRYNRKSYQFDAKCLLALLVMVSVVIIGTVASVQALQPMTLTVRGPEGYQVDLNEVDIGNLVSYRAYGGYKNKLGALKGQGYYTGVPITTFLAMVGGIDSSNNVTIIAPDGYNITLTYNQLNGNLATYDNVTGQPVQHNSTLVPMLAYYYNDTDLPAGSGPLRLAIVGPEGLCTDSFLWVSNVVTLEVVGLPSSGTVGGEWSPITLQTLTPTNALQLLAPWIALTLIAAATAIAGYRRFLKKHW